jgi:DNA gyrase/topoisomerase IV subunit B
MPKNDQYTAAQIQVLEGLEPVRKRPVCILAPPIPGAYMSA